MVTGRGLDDMREIVMIGFSDLELDEIQAFLQRTAPEESRRHDRNGERTGSAALRAGTDTEIVVAVMCLVPLGPTRCVCGYKRRHHDLVLSAPVGDRRVIDAATGNARRPVWQIPTH